MVSNETINRLRKLEHSPFPILSVYLSTNDPISAPESFRLAQWHSLLHSTINKQTRSKLQADILRIEQTLDVHEASARSLIIFSAQEKLWEVVEASFPVTPTIYLEDSPVIAPLTGQLSQFKPYLLLLVDRERLRILHIAQNEISSEVEYSDHSVPQRVRGFGEKGTTIGREDKVFRHIEDHLNWHLDKAFHSLSHFVNSQAFDFVVIGTHKELFKQIRKHLPAALQNKVKSEFIIDLSLPNDKILEKTELILSNLH